MKEIETGVVIGLIGNELLIKEAIASLIRSSGNFEIIPFNVDARAAIGQFARQTPDVILAVDNSLTDEDWAMLGALKTLTSVKLVTLSGTSNNDTIGIDASVNRNDGSTSLFSALRDSARRSGKVVNRVAEIRPYYGRRSRLTPREIEVANLVAQGMPNRKIGQVMGLREQSVKNLVSVVMRKLGCENRVQVALKLTGANVADGPE